MRIKVYKKLFDKKASKNITMSFIVTFFAFLFLSNVVLLTQYK